jgi:drug/metabolite transporter (DMT)-like permease
MGILLALTALFSWGLGDFLIQRSARKFGDWTALFYITAFASIILFPFVYNDIVRSLSVHGVLLWGASFVVLLASLLDFESLRIGKISVIEPIYALEIPVAAILAFYVIHEHLTLAQVVLIVAIMAGIVLVSTNSFGYFKKIHRERGVWQAVLGTIGVGVMTFLFGLGSRETSPLMINWFTSIFIALIALIYLILTSRIKEIGESFKGGKLLILNVGFFDNLAWITFSYAMLYIPIAVATGISEGYIAFAGALGLFFNKEKLRRHQWVGFFLVVIAVIALAFVTKE